MYFMNSVFIILNVWLNKNSHGLFKEMSFQVIHTLWLNLKSRTNILCLVFFFLQQASLRLRTSMNGNYPASSLMAKTLVELYGESMMRARPRLPTQGVGPSPGNTSAPSSRSSSVTGRQSGRGTPPSPGRGLQVSLLKTTHAYLNLHFHFWYIRSGNFVYESSHKNTRIVKLRHCKIFNSTKMQIKIWDV